jgi:hypothetical protein
MNCRLASKQLASQLSAARETIGAHAEKLQAVSQRSKHGGGPVPLPARLLARSAGRVSVTERVSCVGSDRSGCVGGERAPGGRTGGAGGAGGRPGGGQGTLARSHARRHARRQAGRQAGVLRSHDEEDGGPWVGGAHALALTHICGPRGTGRRPHGGGLCNGRWLGLAALCVRGVSPLSPPAGAACASALSGRVE